MTTPSSKAKWLEAACITPRDAFDKWPGLSERQTKTFPLGEEDDAAAWLSRQRKLIDAGVWKPVVVVKHDEKAARLALGEYFPEWLERRIYKGRSLKAGTRYRLRKDGKNQHPAALRKYQAH